MDRFHETYRFKVSDLILEEPSKLGVSKDGSWHGRRPRPSFETHRWSLSSGARSRDPLAMLLRMRLGEDADMIRTSETLY
jgi:hypothetical protein